MFFIVSKIIRLEDNKFNDALCSFKDHSKADITKSCMIKIKIQLQRKQMYRSYDMKLIGIIQPRIEVAQISENVTTETRKNYLFKVMLEFFKKNLNAKYLKYRQHEKTPKISQSFYKLIRKYDAVKLLFFVVANIISLKKC